MTTSSPTSPLVGLQAAAKYLDVSPITVRRLIRQRALRAYRVGVAPNSPIKLRVDDLEAFLRRHEEPLA